MNILLVTPFALTTTGGITTIVRMLAREFTHAGHTVAIFEPGDSTPVVESGHEGSARVFSAYLRELHVPAARLAGAAAFVLKYPLTLWYLHRFLRRKQIDTVIVQYPLPGHSYFGVLRRWSTWRLLVTFQGNDAHDLIDRRPFERVLIRALLDRADCIIGVSSSLLAKVDTAFPALASQKVLIPNGASPPALTPTTALPPLPERFVISVGQLIQRKGIDSLIRAIGVLRRRGVCIDAVVVGEGPERSSLESLAREEGVHGQVHFFGNQDNTRVFSLVDRAMLLVLPSRAEGFPLVAVEAMSLGRPVVASRTDGMVELIEPGQNGLLVEVDDHEGLADAIQSLTENDAIRTAMGDQARRLAAERFTWRTIAGKYEQLAAPRMVRGANMGEVL